LNHIISGYDFEKNEARERGYETSGFTIAVALSEK
jgi:hypothetical protein